MPYQAMKPIFKPDRCLFEQGTGPADQSLELAKLIAGGIFVRLQEKFQ